MTENTDTIVSECEERKIQKNPNTLNYFTTGLSSRLISVHTEISKYTEGKKNP